MDAVIERPEFPGASTAERIYRPALQHIRAPNTDKPSGLHHANATFSPYEDENVDFERHPYHLPPTDGNREISAIQAPWTEAKNQRRCDLIDRKYASGLTPAEILELAQLQEQMLRNRQRVAPLPLEAARRLHQEVLTHASISQSPTDP